MLFTDPFVGLVPRKMSDSELARAIRVNIAAEIDAINLYAAHMEATNNVAARRMLAHIIDEEKEHLAEFLELLKILDPHQAADLDEARKDAAEIMNGTHESEGHGHGAPAQDRAPVPRAADAPRLATVGSLRPGVDNG